MSDACMPGNNPPGGKPGCGWNGNGNFILSWLFWSNDGTGEDLLRLEAGEAEGLELLLDKSRGCMGVISLQSESPPVELVGDLLALFRNASTLDWWSTASLLLPLSEKPLVVLEVMLLVAALTSPGMNEGNGGNAPAAMAAMSCC